MQLRARLGFLFRGFALPVSNLARMFPMVAVLLFAVGGAPVVPPRAVAGEVAAAASSRTPGLELSRAVRPREFLSAVGRRAGLLGREQGNFEAWVYPLKVVRDFRLRFKLPGRTYEGAALARTVTVRPESSSILYAGDTFSVQATWFVPVEEPGAVVFLDVDTTEPLEIEAVFVRDFTLMWPASLGGTYMFWSDEKHAFVFGEEQQRFFAVLGSPTASDPRPEFRGNPASSVQSSFRVGRVEKGRQQLRIFLAASHQGRQQAEETYQALAARAEELREEAAAYYRNHLEETVSVRLPDSQLQNAYDWSRISVLQGLVTNPFLGTGLIAGYGTSGDSQRPGFAWFFGRDALWTVLAQNVGGDFGNARTALEFLTRFQRADGKINHEISQSATFVPWFTDYPYPWASADATPLYILAVADYATRSGDLAFVNRHWDNLRRAYQFLQSTFDDRGFAKNTEAGHGWVEGGPLLPVKTELYQSGLGVAATGALAELAELAGKQIEAAELRESHAGMKQRLNQAFWLPDKKFFAFALDENDKQVEELSVLATVPLWFDVLDAAKTNPMLSQLARADHATDWGMRILSSRSPHFGPAGYHFGSVWPLFTGWASVGEYRYHRAHAGYANLRANALLALEGPLGHATEVLSGATHTELSTSSPHQIWSAAMVISPLLRGLFGLEQDAADGVLTLSPHIPATWKTFELRNVRVGEATVDIAYRRSPGEIALDIRRTGPGDLEFQFAPALSLRAEGVAVEVNDRPVAFSIARNAVDQHPVIRVPLDSGPTTLRIGFRNDFGFHVPASLPPLGAASRNLKLLSRSWSADRRQLELEFAGLSGRAYEVPLLGAPGIAAVEGAELLAGESGARLRLEFPGAWAEGYVRKKVSVRFQAGAVTPEP